MAESVIECFVCSPLGNVSGGLVYAFRGANEDFDVLESNQIAVNGSIVIMRHSKLHPSVQVRHTPPCTVSIIVYNIY